MPHSLKLIKYLGGYKIEVTFMDGYGGVVDFSKSLKFEGIFKALKDIEIFKKAFIDPGSKTISWDNGANYDSDVLYSYMTSKEIEFAIK